MAAPLTAAQLATYSAAVSACSTAMSEIERLTGLAVSAARSTTIQGHIATLRGNRAALVEAPLPDSLIARADSLLARWVAP